MYFGKSDPHNYIRNTLDKAANQYDQNRLDQEFLDRQFREGFKDINIIDVKPPYGFVEGQQFPESQGNSFKTPWRPDMSSNGKKNGNGNGKSKAKIQPKPRARIPKQVRSGPVSIRNANSAQMEYASAAASYGGSVRQFSDAQSMTRIKKCEYIGDLRSTGTAFTLNSFNINVGDLLTFPWLSSIAPAWEYYRVDSLKIVYKPNCSSTAVGTVAIAVDYDMADAAPVNKQDLAEYRPYISGVPWSNNIVYQAPLRFLRLHNNGKLIVRDPSTAITNLTDVGILYVMMQDTAAGFLGELYIDYDIVLINQQQAKLASSLSAKITGVSAGDTSMFSTSFAQTSPSRPWVRQQGTSSILQILITGSWFVEFYATGCVGLTNINCTGSNGAVQVALMGTLLNATSTEGMRSFTITVNSTSNGSPALLTLALAGNTGAATTVIRFAPYDNALA